MARAFSQTISTASAGTIDQARLGFLACYAFVVFLNICLTNWSFAGLPVRAAATVVLFGWMAATLPSLLLRALHMSRLVLLVTAAIAALGIVVSAINGLPAAGIARQLLEIHLQTAIVAVLTTMVALRCGAQSVLMTMVVAVGTSAAFAVGQFLGFGPAWTIRQILGSVQSENMTLAGLFNGERAMGLSLSKTILATQTCLGFAAYGILRAHQRQIAGLRPLGGDMKLAIALFAFVLVSVAGGNRSPILGAAAFLLAYTALSSPKLFWSVAVPAALLAIPLIGVGQELALSMGLRIGETSDKSTESRPALLRYGLLLIRDKPFGHGLAFDPTTTWMQYWSEISDLRGAFNVLAYPLHNYFLSMLNVYGVAILLLAPPILQAMWKHRRITVFFVPYLLHIAFHNAGPFWSDSYIWFVLGALPALQPLTPASPAPLRRAGARTL